MASHKVTNTTLDLIRQFEGLSLTAYWDVSRYSIGYGSGYLANGKKVQSGDSISQAEAEALLLRDVKEAGAYGIVS
jgi:lysozyme